MKNIFRILGMIGCIILGIGFIGEGITYMYSDPWGLTFIFVTIPSIIIGIALLIFAGYLFIELDKVKENIDKRKKFITKIKKAIEIVFFILLGCGCFIGIFSEKEPWNGKFIFCVVMLFIFSILCFLKAYELINNLKKEDDEC